MKYRIYVDEDQLEKIKRIIPNINYQILNNIQPRSARSVEWQNENKEKYREYQKKYRLKKKKEKKNEQQSTKSNTRARKLGLRKRKSHN